MNKKKDLTPTDRRVLLALAQLERSRPAPVGDYVGATHSELEALTSSSHAAVRSSCARLAKRGTITRARIGKDLRKSLGLANSVMIMFFHKLSPGSWVDYADLLGPKANPVITKRCSTDLSGAVVPPLTNRQP